MKTMLKKLLFFMLILPLSVLAQNTFSGKVIDASNNQAMPGVSVAIEGTTSGTFTDSDGIFTLKNVKSGDTVVVLEAMKMANNLDAEKDGKVTAILVQPGESVMEDTPLVIVE